MLGDQPYKVGDACLKPGGMKMAMAIVSVALIVYSRPISCFQSAV
jgi:hypothetical protein